MTDPAEKAFPNAADPANATHPPIDRAAWLGLLAKAPRHEVEDLARTRFGDEVPAHRWLRQPEVGLTMVRGRAGGTGTPFNLGEMTVTRCSLALTDGTVGTAYVAGRDKRKAAVIALLDAWLQTHPEEVTRLLGTVRARAAEREAKAARRAAATKVAFFTMVRGDNPK